jgi:pyruvate formate lyase activating enzyme
MDMRRGTLVPTDELCQRIYRYRRIFARTGGGITISGGEPLMQPRGVSEILQFARDNDIHTAIDTSGFLGVRCSDAMMRNLNLVLLDIKSGVPEVYKRTTNQELGPTLEFAQRLGVAQVPVWVRFVLVPGLTDDRDNIERVAEIASSIPSLERVEVLPFHQMGRDKWEALGFDYKLEETKPPTAEATEQARDIFRRRGIATY